MNNNQWGAPQPPTPPPSTPPPTPPTRSTPIAMWIIGIVAVLVLIGVAALFFLRGGGDSDTNAQSSAPQVASSETAASETATSETEAIETVTETRTATESPSNTREGVTTETRTTTQTEEASFDPCAQEVIAQQNLVGGRFQPMNCADNWMDGGVPNTGSTAIYRWDGNTWQMYEPSGKTPTGFVCYEHDQMRAEGAPEPIVQRALQCGAGAIPYAMAAGPAPSE